MDGYKSSSATMSHRKLLAEIEKVLKKVNEGTKDFEGILSKVNAAASSNQKEKYETDLKKTIKKLQRYRDQIKTWIQSSAIKDKRALIEARKLIESNMEKFKVCEKEMKTKAYSKEGLQQAMQSNDEHPNDRTKRWIRKSLERLRTQIDSFESKIESFQAKKGRRAEAEQIESLRHAIVRHRFHEDSLELILRKLDNETITAEQIDEIRDGVEYYIDTNQDSDFYEDEELYDDLVGTRDMLSPRSSQGGSGDEAEDGEGHVNIDTAEKEADSAVSSAQNESIEAAPIPLEKEPSPPAPAEAPPGRAVAPTTHAGLRSSHAELKNYKTAATAEPTAALPTVVAKDVEPENTKRSRDRSTDSAPQSRSATPVTSGAAPVVKSPTEPTRYETEPSAAKPPARTASEVVRGTSSGNAPVDIRVNSQSAPAQRAGTPQQAHPAQALPQQPTPQVPQAQPPAPSTTQGPGMHFAQPTVPENGDMRHFPSLMQLSEQQLFKYRERMTAASPGLPPAYRTSSPQLDRLGIVEAVEDSKNDETFEDADPVIPGTLADLASATLEMESQAVRKLAEHPVPAHLSQAPTSLPQHVQQPPQQQPPQPQLQPQLQGNLDLMMLEASMETLPESMDLERPKQYNPQNPYPTPSYYPSAPASVFDNPAIFEKFDTDTLFFIFYYQQGTYQQYLAARELKKQSWRYHKKYLTWFQRHEEPKEITNDYEQGTYVYFDYESGWCQRKKTEFTFEYRYLEEDPL